MNTITLQINDKQYRSLMELLDYAQADLQSDLRNASDEESEAEAEDMLAQHEDVTQAITRAKSYLWIDTYGRLELEIAAEHIDAIATPGDNEPACRAAIESDAHLKAQLELISECASREFLSEAGIEDVDGKSDEEVRLYILWMACHDIAEERNQEG